LRTAISNTANWVGSNTVKQGLTPPICSFTCAAICALSVSITDSTNVLCFGDSTGTATVTPSGGIPPYTFSWDDPLLQSDSTADSLPAGTYKVIVNDGGGCTDSATVTIIQPLALVATMTDSTDIACFGDSTGSATVTPAGGTPPYTYLWNDPLPAQTDSTAISLSAGTFTVIVTDANGCVDSATVTLVPLSAPVLSITDTTHVLCNGDSTGSATVTPGGITIPPFSFSWDDPLLQTDSTAINLPAGTFIVIVTDGVGCSKSDTITIFQPTVLTAGAGINDTICVGDSVIIGGSPTATGGIPLPLYTYSWAPVDSLNDATLSNPMSKPIITTTYTVVVTDGVGCTAIDSLTITADSIPIANVTPAGPVSICAGDSILLTSDPATIYQWYRDGSILVGETGFEHYANTAGNYTIVVTNVAGCADSLTTAVIVTVTAPLIPNVTIGATPVGAICFGDMVNFAITSATDSGATPSYQWQLNGTNIGGATSNTYSSTTLINGDLIQLIMSPSETCVNPPADTSLPITMTVNPTYTTPAADTICDNDSILLGGSYQNTPGTYYDTLPSVSGCDSVIATALWVNLTYLTPAADTICDNDSILLGGSYQNTSGTYYDTLPSVSGCDSVIATALWVNLTYLTSAADTICDNDSILLGGSYQNTSGTYYDTLPSVSGCDSVIVTALMVNPTYTANVFDSICNGDSILLEGSYQTTSGTYYDTLVSVNGCDSVIATALIVNPVYVINLNTGICQGDSIFLVDNWQDTSGIYYDTLSSSSGCDSIIITDLTVSDTIISNIAVGICDGDSLFAGGSWQTISGTYYDTLPASSGCDSVIVTALTVNTSPTAEAGFDVFVCAGGSVQLNATGGGFYSWNPTDSLSNPLIANPIANPAATTTYTVTVTDSAGCVNSDSLTVAIVGSLTADAGVDTSTCLGSGVQLLGTGGSNYSWSPIAGLSNPLIANPIASPAVNTIYTLTVSSGACSDTDAVVVTVNPLPTAEAGFDVFVCAGGSVQLNATGGGVYSWNPTDSLSDPLIANPIANPAATTTYTVTVTDSAGCVNSDSLTVAIVGSLTANAGSDTSICLGSSVQLLGTGGGNYSWSPAAGLSSTTIANPIANPAVPTTYTLTVSSGACSDTDAVVVSVDTIPTANVTPPGPVSFCAGDSILLISDPAAFYQWYRDGTLLAGEIAANYYAKLTGNYTIVVTNAAGCADSLTTPVTVSVDALPTANVIPVGPISICAGDSILLTSDSAAFYQWYRDGSLLAGETSITHYATITGNYTIVVTNGFGCTDSLTSPVVVSVDTIPIANINPSGPVSFCAGDSILLTSDSAAFYQWYRDGTLLTGEIAANYYAKLTGNYTIVVTNAAGCADSLTTPVTVSVDALPTANVAPAGPVSFCAGDSTLLTSDSAAFYQWYRDGSLLAGEIAITHYATIAGNYTIVVTNGFGCTDSLTSPVVVSVDPGPTAIVNADTIICLGDSAQLTASGGSSYLWAPPTGLSCTICLNPKASPATTTLYTVTVTNAAGCSDDSSVTVTVLPPGRLNTADTVVCLGERVQLNAVGGTNYSWNPALGLNDPNISNPIASPDTTTTYTVLISGTGCPLVIDSVTITVLPVPMIIAGPDTTIAPGESVQLFARGGDSYKWTPITRLSNDTIADPLATPSESIMYIVEGTTDSNGCTSVDTVFIEVDDSNEIFIPEMFSPNGDGVNDILLVNSRIKLTKIEFKIYNRWGKLIFVTTDPDNIGWNGKYKEEDQDMDTYIYDLKAETLNGKEISRSGKVLLVR